MIFGWISRNLFSSRREEKTFNIHLSMDGVKKAEKKTKTKDNARKNIYVCFYEKCMKAYTTVNVLYFI